MILPIETASLRLRAFVAEDAPEVFRMSREEGMRIWMPSQVYRDEAHAASVLELLIAQYAAPGDPRRGPYVLGIENKDNGVLIGHVGLSPFGDDVEIGYAIGASEQHRGFATQAVRAMCDAAGRAFALRRIVGVTAAGNVASQAVLRRAGFGRWREDFMRFQGVEQPVVVFALEQGA